MESVTILTRQALAASARNDSETAIGLLKRAIELDPGAGAAHHLLGAEYAQIGMIDKAIDQMRQAVACDADLAIARFQLGLLLLTTGDVNGAQEAWAALDRLGEAHPLRIFREGLLAMAQDRFADARRLIEDGIRGNGANDALNRDMRKVLEALAPARDEAPVAAHVLISTYGGSA